MNIIDIVLIVILAVVTVSAVIYLIRNRKKTCCSGDCANCAGCGKEMK